MNLIWLTVAVFCTLTRSITALQCYSCEGQDDHPCVTNPQATATVTCRFNQQCYSRRKESADSSGSSVSMKRGCTQSLITTASSVGGSGVSVSSQSCSTDLCNTGDARQNFNLNNFNDFLNSINNLNAAPVLYPVYTGYPAFSLGNLGNFPQNNKGNYPGNLAVNYPWYGNYPSVPVPDQTALLTPFYNVIASALNYQLQQLPVYGQNDE